MSGNRLLFPKSTLPFDLEVFVQPTAEYRGAPLWSWNTKLEKDRLMRQIDHFREMGMGGFHMHPRNGLDNSYMGPEFLDLVATCVEYAADRGMLPCLYDEDRWPSGGAGGLVTRAHPEYASQHLLLTRVKYGEGTLKAPAAFLAFAARSERGRLLARYDIQLDAEGRLSSYKRLEDGASTDPQHLYYAYLEPNLPSDWFNSAHYADTLNKSAIAYFIEITHEKYKARVGSSFGNVIPTIFTDEPQFTHKTQLSDALSNKDVFLPWTSDLDVSFQEHFEYSLLDKLPEVVWDLPRNAPSLARYHFHDHVCERFVCAFMDQLAGWCRNHGILLTGHMMEEPFLETQTASLGEAMRCYRQMDLPGIDLLCDQFEFNTVKQASSVARQNGRRGVMSEIYGVTNWTFTFEGHKGCGDWQAALGITFRVHHLTHVSLAGEGKRDFPACIGYQSPWHREYPLIENHFARVNVAMTRGTPVTRVAVIHPIESYWLCYGPVSTGNGEPEFRESCHRDLTDWLLRGLMDFDFVSESLLPTQTSESSAGPLLQVGCCNYEVVIVPNLKTIRSTTIQRLRAFAAAGGKVLIAGETPSLVDLTPLPTAIEKATIVPWTKHHIFAALLPSRDIWITNSKTGKMTDTLLYQMREEHQDRYLFICNTERIKSVHTNVSIRGTWQAILLDTFDGSQSRLSVTYANSRTNFQYLFEGASSLLLRLLPGTIQKEPYLNAPLEKPLASENQKSF